MTIMNLKISRYNQILFLKIDTVLKKKVGHCFDLFFSENMLIGLTLVNFEQITVLYLQSRIPGCF